RPGDAKSFDAWRGHAERAARPAAPPHHHGRNAHRDESEGRAESQNLVGGSKELALVSRDTDADDAVEQRLLAERLLAQQCAGPPVELELTHARPVLRLAAYAP